MIEKYKWYIIGAIGLIGTGIVTALLIDRFKKRGGKTWDSSTDEKIATLHPKIREKATEFINKAEKEGIKLRVTSGFRTYEEQDKLYAQGRTTSGSVVTNARAGHSNHNFATAFDVVPIENGSANYDSNQWQKIGQIGKSFGFKWGGDWQGLIDMPHFEMNFGNTVAELRNKYESGEVRNGYVIV